METLERLGLKIKSADELNSVVKIIKAITASNIGQYEMATSVLNDYYLSIELGMLAYLKQESSIHTKKYPEIKKNNSVGAIVFGSDQGLVGQFNSVLADFTKKKLDELNYKTEIWTIGNRIQEQFVDLNIKKTKTFSAPNSVTDINALVSKILIKIGQSREKDELNEFYIFYNKQKKNQIGYESYMFKLIPFDNKRKEKLALRKWPTNKLPQVVGNMKSTLSSLIGEYLYVSIFRASAESLSSENASRLAAMQRAEKNIDELKVELYNKYQQLRQSSIDEELFDVVSGFEALKKKKN